MIFVVFLLYLFSASMCFADYFLMVYDTEKEKVYWGALNPSQFTDVKYKIETRNKNDSIFENSPDHVKWNGSTFVQKTQEEITTVESNKRKKEIKVLIKYYIGKYKDEIEYFKETGVSVVQSTQAIRQKIDELKQEYEGLP